MMAIDIDWMKFQSVSVLSALDTAAPAGHAVPVSVIRKGVSTNIEGS